MFTVRAQDSLYISAMIGNGQVVTTLGPTGYHNGFCPPEEAVNRTIFWAGRRLSDARSMDIHIPRVPPEELIGPTRPLVRLGRFARALEIDGRPTTDQDWEQSVDYDEAVVSSTLFHGPIREQTRSWMCLTTNVIVFNTRLENTGGSPSELVFTLDYEFGDADGQRPSGSRYHIRRPHPDDLSFGNVEGTRSLDTDLDNRPPHLLENLSVQYEIEGHIGEVRIGRSPNGKIQQTEFGGRFIHTLRLEAGQSTDLWFWAAISDRTQYTHYPPDLETVQGLLEDHRQAWAEFWKNGRITFGEPQLEAIYRSALYTLRCNASPITIPPGYLSTHWEGRIFHDDFYCFLGLSGGNHLDIARRVVQNRLNTLPVARRRSLGHGTYFGWEVTEDGEESAPFGHWTDEMFRHGQISESAWRYYLYTRSLRDLEQFYPLMKGCAEWLIHDTIVFDADGKVKTRLCTDILEAVYPVYNGVYIGSATIRTLLNAARAAELLGVDAEERETWRHLAGELRKNLPVDAEKGRYRYAENEDAPLAYAHSAMVFPFPFDVNGELARATVDQSFAAFQERQAVSEEMEQAVLTDNWLWEVSGLACALLYQGKGDQGLEVLHQAPLVVGPFMTVNEHFRADGGPYLSWFCTGSGVYTSAVQCMFVQLLDEQGTVVLPALPSSVQEASFQDLLGDHQVVISGQVKDGKLAALTVRSSKDQPWKFRIPTRHAPEGGFREGLSISGPDQQGFLTVTGELKQGLTSIL